MGFRVKIATLMPSLHLLSLLHLGSVSGKSVCIMPDVFRWILIKQGLMFRVLVVFRELNVVHKLTLLMHRLLILHQAPYLR